jgi:hypothetical protein
MTLTMMHVFEDFRRFGGPYRVHYSVTTADGREHAIGEATWADWDQRGRLIVAREGQLLVWREPDHFEVLADFNGQEPDPLPAPDWARSDNRL